MCAGEMPPDLLGHDAVRLSLIVTNVDIEAADVKTEAHSALGVAFTNAMAQALDISPDDIAIHTVTVVRGSGTLRRWLQDLVDATISATITVDSDATAALMAQIDQLRNTSATTINVGEASAADTSTLTQPVLVLQDGLAGIQCRVGHDSTSPLCHLCLDGWSVANDQTCVECDDESVAWFRVVALAAAILVGCLLLVLAYTCYRKMAARGAQKEAGMLQWVKPNFVSGGAVPLKIYGKVSTV
jgi:hypothetical protein